MVHRLCRPQIPAQEGKLQERYGRTAEGSIHSLTYINLADVGDVSTRQPAGRLDF